MFWQLSSTALLSHLFYSGIKGFKNGLIEELGRLIGLIKILISMSNRL